MILLEAGNSHLYKGAQGHCPTALPTAGQNLPAVIHFADGSRTNAELHENTLQVAPYRTNASTQIPAKSWTLEFTENGRFRVTEGPAV